MANLFTNMVNNFGMWLGHQIAPYINDALGQRDSILTRYYTGDHNPQLKASMGKDGRPIDDNIIQNFTGLAVDRSVSRLFRGGVQFNLPEGADAQQEYIDKVWDLNKKEIILYQVGLHGAVYGTPYFQISPDAIIDPYTEKPYPRLIAIDPTIVRIKTNPQDMNDVEEYRIEYACVEERNGRQVEVGHRKLIHHAMSEAQEVAGGVYLPSQEMETWVIEEYEQVGGAPWELIDQQDWPYNFPPIIHWKNLPSLKSCYGDSDIDDAVNIQNKSNFVVSNTGKIIKFHAHPETIGTGFQINEMKAIDQAVGSFHAIPNADAKVYNLEMQSDLASSVTFGNILRQSIFDIAREVDISSITDKVGALTNFGLHVLYTDALDKNDTKRQLYGDALKELNRRLLVIAGFTGADSDPGKITWGEAMIVNTLEEMQVDQLALNMKIVDLETITKRYQSRYGVDWETIQANLGNQALKDNANNADIGTTILRNFTQGRGVTVPARQPR